MLLSIVSVIAITIPSTEGVSLSNSSRLEADGQDRMMKDLKIGGPGPHPHQPHSLSSATIRPDGTAGIGRASFVHGSLSKEDLTLS